MRPSPTSITDLAQVFQPSGGGWRPSGTTVVVGSGTASGSTTLVAIALGPGGRVGAPAPIVTIAQGPWSLRADGGAVALAVSTDRGSRIAIWDVRAGAGRWLNTADPRRNDFSPLWSKDGAFIYYLSSADDAGESGIFEIAADGSARRQIMKADDRTGPPESLTPDGKGLVWSRGQAGGSVEILDIATGVSRHLEDVARVLSWRSQQPRVLLGVGGCCAGRPGGSLVAWDDIALTSRVVAERGQYGNPAWGYGAWDPSGTRIAAARFDDVSPYEATLVIVDPETGTLQPIAGTQGASIIQWLPEGIVFSLTHVRQAGAALMFLPNGGSGPVSLYDVALLQGIAVVRP